VRTREPKVQQTTTTEEQMDQEVTNNEVRETAEGPPPEQQLTGTNLNRPIPPTGFLQEQNPKWA
jgi:hypothetical protein